ncbi:hypothetical protein D9M68_720320 [compost metagenome]
MRGDTGYPFSDGSQGHAWKSCASCTSMTSPPSKASSAYALMTPVTARSLKTRAAAESYQSIPNC